MSAVAGRDDPIDVLIVDDQALVRRGFRMILEIEPDLRVVGEAEDGERAVQLAVELRPDIVLMDVRMPVLDGIEATRQVTARCGTGTRVVMLTTFDLDDYVYRALEAGASGFVLKDVRPELLVSGLRSVHHGEALLGPTVTSRLIESYLGRTPGGEAPDPERVRALASLTAREREVLDLVARGLSNAEIAREIYVSETTVKTHVSRVLMKLGLRDRVQAVIFVHETGVPLPDRSRRPENPG